MKEQFPNRQRVLRATGVIVLCPYSSFEAMQADQLPRVASDLQDEFTRA